MGATRPDIRYVFLTDLHLGEENSLLTHLAHDRFAVDPSLPSLVLQQLAVCLAQLTADNAEPPCLVLGGDVVDLAFGTISQALMSFERLLEALLPDGRPLVSRILYLPGNHDHHVWEIARETQYVRTILDAHHPDGLPEPQHATPLDATKAVPSYLLNQVARHLDRRHEVHRDDDEPAIRVDVAYPNLGLAAERGDRYLVVHHGHYVERLYHFISDLRRWVFPDRDAPATVHQLEAENFAWIDFVWSLLGRSGAAGTDVEAFFKMLHYPHRVDGLARDLAGRLAAARNIPGVPGDWLEARVLERLFGWLGSKVSRPRHDQGRAIERAIDQGLRGYLFGPTMRQLADELGAVPDDLAFVFGHTHKPFERTLTPAANGGAGRSVAVVNTGGWTVDAAEPHPAHGASILVADDRLELVAIHVYREGEAGDSLAGGPALPEAVAVNANRPGAAALEAEVRRRMADADEPADFDRRPGAGWVELARRIAHGIDERRKWIVRTFHD